MGISRGSVYYLPRSVSLSDLALIRRMDELHPDFPFAGSRMLCGLVAAEEFTAGRLSITMEAWFCVEVLEDELAHYGRPEIFNTDQGSQFTSTAFVGVLADKGTANSMDDKGAWRDNAFVERLWRTIKYEESICAPTTLCATRGHLSAGTSSSTTRAVMPSAN